jgi:putative copper export protein/methionine-rich copper-binding protein CopC
MIDSRVDRARPYQWPRVLFACLLLILPAAGLAAVLHVRLESSTPGANETIETAAAQLRLHFSGRIEPRYSSVTLTAPDGSGVPLGVLEFPPDTDREFTAALPPISMPGVYTVRWRTAGADGHVLEGSYTFTFIGDTAAAALGPLPAQPPPAHDHGHGHGHGRGHEHEHAPSPGGAALAVFARWLHFSALALVIGAAAARVLLLPRLEVGASSRAAVQRSAWRTLALSALLLAAAAVLRLWLQSATLHGADHAWSSTLLSIMLTDTTWGRAWLVQTSLFALLGAGIAVARPPRDRYALFLAVPAVLGLAAVPAMQGHAAGATGFASIAVMNDAVHVVAVGAWLGLLALLMLAVLPAVRRHESDGGAARVHTVDRFSPIALGAAALVVVTGIINTLMHISTPAQLWETRYGAALIAKLAVLSLVVVAGFYNWRVVRPRLAEDDYTKRLRFSAGFELTVAAFVLLSTAILTGLPRP